VIGGLVMGVLSALPLIGPIGNACCCLWVIGGGMVAAYMLQQNQSAAITPGDGALVGLLAGLIGAFVHTILSIPIDLLLGPMERAMAERFIDMAGSMPPEVRELLDRYGRGGQAAAFMVVGYIFGLMFWLFVGGIFSTIGGLLGSAIFRKKTPPGTIDVSPSMSS
jgi:hypothetical protein